MPRWTPFEPYFWSLVQKGDGCWMWLGGLDGKGYGRVWRDGRRQAAHRVAWELTNGPIGDLYACHHCDNKRCVNPAHVFLGTQQDNMQDWTKKGKNKLVTDASLLKRGDEHWTRSSTGRRIIANKRSEEFAAGRRVLLRGASGRIIGTRMVP